MGVEILYKKLYKLFVTELLNLNIGYSYNKNILFKINELVNAIDYIQNNNLKAKDVIKTIQYYEQM